MMNTLALTNNFKGEYERKTHAELPPTAILEGLMFSNSFPDCDTHSKAETESFTAHGKGFSGARR